MQKRNIFDELVAGFDDLKAQRAGKKTLRTTTLEVRRLEPLTPERIVALREKLGFSQPVFSRLLHINPATLKNWEQGKSRPNNEAQTLLRLVENDPDRILRDLADLR